MLDEWPATAWGHPVIEVHGVLHLLASLHVHSGRSHLPLAAVHVQVSGRQQIQGQVHALGPGVAPAGAEGELH